MGLKDKFLSFVAPVEDDEEYEEEEVEETQAYAKPTRPVSSYEQTRNKQVHSTLASDTKMVLFEPRSFEEAEEVARHLKSGRRLSICIVCSVTMPSGQSIF